MFTLTTTQESTLSQAALGRFTVRLLQRLPEYWPGEIERFGPQRARAAVETAIAQALELGFRTELDVARFVHLAFAFGSLQFHQQPWAAAALAEPEVPGRIRMNRLFDAAMTQLQAAEAAPARGSAT